MSSLDDKVRDFRQLIASAPLAAKKALWEIAEENPDLYLRVNPGLMDGKTRLYSEPFFRRQISGLIQDVHEGKRNTFSLVLSDLDDFGKVNKTYNHDEGDKVLIEAAKRYMTVVRDGSVVRFGGEENYAILPDTGINEAEIVARRMLGKLKGEPIMISGYNSQGQYSVGLKITASLGVVEYKPWMSMTELTYFANEAEHRAKELGKNKIVSLDELACRKLAA